jgi:AraC family transcriptional regulator, exoenzyme S synthesis regulatory protein ExsA
MLRIPSEIQANQFESLKIQENTFVAYRSDVYPSKNDVFFEENAVIYVLEGDKIFNSTSEEVKVKKGDVLFVKRGFYLMSESIDASYRSLVFFFDEKILKEFVAQNLDIFKGLNESKGIESESLLKLNSNEAFGKYIESLQPFFKTQTTFLNQFLKLKVQEMLLHLIELDKGKDLSRLLFQIYKGQKTELDYILNTYYLKPLTLSELAKISGRSLSVFKREFNTRYGMSPGTWIRDKKLDHAAFLLKNNMANVVQIAEEIGFESVSHFIKCFKAKFGKTPKQFESDTF